MREMRSQATVLVLLGPDTDRDSLSAYLEQAGYKAQAFKNPAVFFECVRDEKPFTVVLETSALRMKLSEWVGQLQNLSEKLTWIAMAPQSQFPILAGYQNRGLAEIIATDMLYTRERLLWALDRELEKWNLKKVRALEFVEATSGPNQIAHATQAQPVIEKDVDLQTLLDLRLQDAALRRRPLVLGVLTLDDPEEISSFWGDDVLKQVRTFLPELIRLHFGTQNCLVEQDRNYILLNTTTPEFLSDVKELQSQLQDQGRAKFGFRISLSGGVCEASVHARESREMRRLADEACRHMSSRGGGRVGIPKPIQGGLDGDIPQNLG